MVTIGNFDGVHLAHQKLLRRVVEVARPRGAMATAITFEPHPIKFLAPAHAPELLTPLRPKGPADRPERHRPAGGASFQPRTRPPIAPGIRAQRFWFIRLHTVAVHVGPNFRFGYRQAGDAEILEELGRQEGFQAWKCCPCWTCAAIGFPARASGNCWPRARSIRPTGCWDGPSPVSGPIVAGMGVGRKHTVPTLNLAPIEEQLPKTGVYVTHTLLGERAPRLRHQCRHKPTFGDHQSLTVETFLLDFPGGEIDQTDMEIEFLYRLRDEIKFQNPAILKVQIQEDARRSLKFFRLFRAFGAASERQFHPKTPRAGASLSQPGRPPLLMRRPPLLLVLCFL